jgi:antitoxin HigA-1
MFRPELDARSLSAALALCTPSGRITDILNGKRGVSPETALRLARYFGNSGFGSTFRRRMEAELGEWLK